MDPNWTDVVQAIAAIIAVPGAIAGFIVLFRRDKGKQEQINKLSDVVGQLEAQNEILIDGNNVLRDYQIELTTILEKNDEGGAQFAAIEEKRLRLMVKPRLWSNGGGYRGYENTWHMNISNKGESCVIDSIKQVDGNDIEFHNREGTEIEKDNSIILNGSTKNKHPKDTWFQLCIEYHDQGDYKYESIFSWNGGKVKLLETKEL